MGATKIRSQAARWLIKVQTTQDLDGLWPDFDAWLEESPEHRKAYELEERRWAALDALRECDLHNSRLTPEGMVQAAAESRRHTQMWAKKAGIGAGAVVICSIALAMLWMSGGQGRVEAHTWMEYTAGDDQLSPVMLEDGSVLQLNAHSQARTRLTDAVREVALDTGEAYFDVSSEHARPFNVWAGSVLVQATGTAFSVKKEEDGQVEATVRRGSVQVKSTTPSHTVRAEVRPESQKLGPGEAATIGPSGEMTVDQVDPAEMAKRLAWANRVIDLNGTLGDAVAQFNRFNARKLVIREAELAEIRISGRFPVTEPDKFAESLKHLGIKHVVVGSEGAAEGQILLSRN